MQVEIKGVDNTQERKEKFLKMKNKSQGTQGKIRICQQNLT